MKILLIYIIPVLFFLSCKKTVIISNSPATKPPTEKGIVKWEVDHTIDFRNAFYQLNTEPNETGKVTIENDGQHGKVFAVNKPAGFKRAELARTEPSLGEKLDYVPAEGDEVYLAWRMKINIEGDKFPTGGFAVFQNKSNSPHSQNYPFIFDHNGKELSLIKYDAGTGSQASRAKVLWSIPLAENQWGTIVVGVKFSKNSNTGFIKLWFNDVAQNLEGDDKDKKVFHRTLDDSGNYFKWGVYNEISRPFNITNYLTDMKIASTYEAARPK